MSQSVPEFVTLGETVLDRIVLRVPYCPPDYGMGVEVAPDYCCPGRDYGTWELGWKLLKPVEEDKLTPYSAVLLKYVYVGLRDQFVRSEIVQRGEQYRNPVWVDNSNDVGIAINAFVRGHRPTADEKEFNFSPEQVAAAHPKEAREVTGWPLPNLLTFRARKQCAGARSGIKRRERAADVVRKSKALQAVRAQQGMSRLAEHNEAQRTAAVERCEKFLTASKAGMTYKQIAAAYGVSESSVKGTISRYRKYVEPPTLEVVKDVEDVPVKGEF